MKMKQQRKAIAKVAQPKVKKLTKVASGRRKLPVISANEVEEVVQQVGTNVLHHDHVVVTVENITPHRATRLLEDNNINRNLNQGHVDEMAEDMKLGRWTHCPAPIVVYDNGNVADGQHRLWAIIDSGKSQKFTVHRGLRQPEGLNLDKVLPRSLVDGAKISGLDPTMTAKLASAARAIEEGTPQFVRTSNSHKLAAVDKHRQAANFAIKNLYGAKIANGPTHGAVGRAWYALDEPGRAKLQRFCEVLRTGQAQGIHESAGVTLRNYLIMSVANLSGTALWVDTFYRTQHAIKKFLAGNQMLHLSQVKSDCYPLSKDND